MSLRPTRWLIELRDSHRPQGLYLHVFDDGDHAWSADRTRALRFAERRDAEAFALAEVDRDFVAAEHPAADLVGAVELHDEDADDGDVAADL